ncbi:MAG: HNH endonuclease [Cellulomonas sp.]
MSAISDILQIGHFDCAAGSTVERPFLEAVAEGLGIDGSRASFSNKETLLSALLEEVTTFDPVPFISEGGTITNEALAAILQGIKDTKRAKVSLTDGAAAVRIALALFDEGADASVFDPLKLSDERKRALRDVVIREGQSTFRSTVFNAYNGMCAITGVAVPEVLQAAHIRPYAGPKSNLAQNGILLRADLHRMWDTGLLAVDECSNRVLLASRLVVSDYTFLADREIRHPTKPSQHPSSLALKQQREWAGL